jgi:hypothetical protein
MLQLQRLLPRYQDKIAFVPVSLDRSIEDARTYMDNNGFDIKAYGNLKGTLLHKLDIRYVPTTLLVDAKGNLLRKHVGSLTDKDMESLLKSAIK